MSASSAPSRRVPLPCSVSDLSAAAAALEPFARLLGSLRGCPPQDMLIGRAEAHFRPGSSSALAAPRPPPPAPSPPPPTGPENLSSSIAYWHTLARPQSETQASNPSEPRARIEARPPHPAAAAGQSLAEAAAALEPFARLLSGIDFSRRPPPTPPAAVAAAHSSRPLDSLSLAGSSPAQRPPGYAAMLTGPGAESESLPPAAGASGSATAPLPPAPGQPSRRRLRLRSRSVQIARQLAALDRLMHPQGAGPGSGPPARPRRTPPSGAAAGSSRDDSGSWSEGGDGPGRPRARNEVLREAAALIWRIRADEEVRRSGRGVPVSPRPRAPSARRGAGAERGRACRGWAFGPAVGEAATIYSPYTHLQAHIHTHTQ